MLQGLTRDKGTATAAGRRMHVADGRQPRLATLRPYLPGPAT